MVEMTEEVIAEKEWWYSVKQMEGSKAAVIDGTHPALIKPWVDISPNLLVQLSNR